MIIFFLGSRLQSQLAVPRRKKQPRTSKSSQPHQAWDSIVCDSCRERSQILRKLILISRMNKNTFQNFIHEGHKLIEKISTRETKNYELKWLLSLLWNYSISTCLIFYNNWNEIYNQPHWLKELCIESEIESCLISLSLSRESEIINREKFLNRVVHLFTWVVQWFQCQRGDLTAIVIIINNLKRSRSDVRKVKQVNDTFQCSFRQGDQTMKFCIENVLANEEKVFRLKLRRMRFDFKHGNVQERRAIASFQN